MNAPTPASTLEQPYVLQSVADGVATLTLNRGERFNPLSSAMIAALSEALDGIAKDAAIRTVVLAANGRGFCAGHDLKELRAHPDEAWQRSLFTACGALMLKITRLPQPVIARVHGIATAAGCQLTATCDLAVATDDARFALPGVNIGLFCSTPAVAVGRNLNRKRTMEMLLTGDMVDAQTALDWGLINRAVPAAELDAEIKKFTDAIQSKSAASVALGKEVFYRQLDMDLPQAYALTAETMTCNMGLEDAAEGIDAFIAKRAPQWKGRSPMDHNTDKEEGYTRLRPLDAACEDAGVTQALTPRGEMLVVNKLAGKLEFYRVDASDDTLDETREPLASIEMPKFPHEVLLSRDHKFAYVSIYGQGVFGKNFDHPGEEVVIIDLDTRARIGSISTLPYKAPHGMAFDAEGLLWVSCDVSGVILVVDPAKREILKAIPTGSNGTHWLTITPDGARLYASNKTYPNLVVIDTRKREVIKQIPLAPGSEGLALSPDGSRLYVTAQRPQQFYVVDTAGDEVIATVPISVFAPVEEGKNPQKRVKVSPDGKLLVISSFASGEIAIVDTADLSSQRLLKVEKGPMGISFESPARAYVMNHDQGSIMLIDLPSAAILGRFETAPGPETMALF